MFKSIRIRAAVTIVLCLAALVYLAPSLTSDLPDTWKKYLPTDRIHLGLDLQGGMHLVLEVETAKAVESTLERTANDLKENLMENRVRFKLHERTKERNVTFEFPDVASREAFDKILHNQYPDLEAASSEIVEGKGLVSLKIKDKRAAEIKKMAVEQSLETIRNRVDQFGISEPEIIPQGTDRIIVQLPGVKDPARAKNLIGRTALLEFKLVDEEHSLEEALKGNVPEGSVVANESRMDRDFREAVGDSASSQKQDAHDRRRPGDAPRSRSATASANRTSPSSSTPRGRRTSTGSPAENVKKRLAIVLDGVVHSAPVIQERISGGQAQITGSFTMEEASDLAIVLARRRAARAGEHPRGADGRSLPRPGFDRQGNLGQHHRRAF